MICLSYDELRQMVEECIGMGHEGCYQDENGPDMYLKGKGYEAESFTNGNVVKFSPDVTGRYPES